MLRMLRIRTVARAPEAPKGFRPLLPLVCHPGGKSKSRGLIYRRMPAHDRYVEPFAGGASIFWGKPPSPKGDVLSDADRPLMGFYRRLNCAQLQRARASGSNAFLGTRRCSAPAASSATRS